MDKQKMLKQIIQMSSAMKDIERMCYMLSKDTKNQAIYNKVLSYSKQCESKLRNCTTFINSLDREIKEATKIIDSATKEVKKIK